MKTRQADSRTVGTARWTAEPLNQLILTFTGTALAVALAIASALLTL